MIIMACLASMFCETIYQARVDFNNFIATIYKHNHADKLIDNNQPFDWQAWEKNKK